MAADTKAGGEEPRDLARVIEAFLSAPEAERKAALKALTRAYGAALARGAFDDAATALRAAVVPTLDYTSGQSLVRHLGKLRDGAPGADAPVKLAVVGSYTTQQLTALIELFLFAAGVDAEIYEADYDVFRQEILDPTSGLHAFGPQFVYVCSGWHDLANVPGLDVDADRVNELVDAELAEWGQLWGRMHGTSGCQVVQNNFVPPPYRLLANHEMQHGASLGTFVDRINRAMVERSPAHVTVHDVDHLAAQVGRRVFSESRFFHHAKLPCAPECLVEYAHSVASVITAQLGLSKKCLVLDLDNTLWGGVVGDDGLGGIRLGQGDPESEAFQEIQRYARGLRERGVILAVCSANEEKNAVEVFTDHPEMVLKLDDISCFVANWTDKATNLRAIAQELNIGLSSLVFLDDDPGQRALVRQFLPEVAVPEVPPDPSEVIAVLDRHRYFQVVSVGSEDLKRTELYRANAERQSSMSASTSIDDFLATLEMKALVGPIAEANMQRSAQLIGRTNQFNLTTRRHPPATVQSIAADSDWVTRTVRLTDRFGDNGLISVLLAKKMDGVLDIDTWLMSCRVLRRGVENMLMNDLHALARSEGLGVIRGEYIPTAKNGIVSDHYETLGFALADSREGGHTVWELAVSDDWQPMTTFIEQTETGGDG